MCKMLHNRRYVGSLQLLLIMDKNTAHEYCIQRAQINYKYFIVFPNT